MLLLFPPNSPFFRLAMDTKTKADLDGEGELGQKSNRDLLVLNGKSWEKLNPVH